MKNKTLLFLRLITAILFLQTLFYKFTASPESVYIFSKLGLEPLGRIASGVFELIAAILIIIPATNIIGSILSLGIISGAIVSHLTILGIVVMDDGGLLFFLALVIFFSSSAILFLQKEELFKLLIQIKKRGK
jgi:uncharacterized membrane protein YphA (DoxX/SURF4 family)